MHWHTEFVTMGYSHWFFWVWFWLELANLDLFTWVTLKIVCLNDFIFLNSAALCFCSGIFFTTLPPVWISTFALLVLHTLNAYLHFLAHFCLTYYWMLLNSVLKMFDILLWVYVAYYSEYFWHGTLSTFGILLLHLCTHLCLPHEWILLVY